jgi:hypothetical protein
MEIRKMSQSELDEAIKQELERIGGYDAWRKRRWANQLPSKPPKPRTPTKAEQYADACKLAAQYRGISIEQLFKQEPERYKRYRQLVLEE